MEIFHEVNGPGLRLAEVLASLSLAIDLGLGQPMEKYLRTCLLAVRLGKLLGASSEDMTAIYYLGLIQHLGCTAYADDTAAVLGDDIETNSWLLTTDHGNPTEMLSAMLLHVGQGEAALQRVSHLLRALMIMPKKNKEVLTGRCEVAQFLAARIGLDHRVRDGLGQVYERWDGKGEPQQLKGEAILLPVRVVQVAQDAECFFRLEGKDHVIAVLRKRAGGMYDPQIVESCCQHADLLSDEVHSASLWDAVLAAEPGSASSIPNERLDEVLRALADFVDLKSPYTLGHSSGVAELAAKAARCCGLPEADITAIRRAGFLHDLGRIGIPNTIWDKPGPLSHTEWERVRLHPYYTERMLAPLKALGSICTLAAQHHERLDGSGYHRGIPASLLPMSVRILAAADIYHAMTEPRPHRPAQSDEVTAAELRRMVQAGLLDDEAVRAVLEVTGHRVRSTRRAWVARLSDREIEVLRLIARGHSERQMAALLYVSERTVHHHVEHIYNKIGVSTRASAALFAMQHNLLSDMDEAEK
jgi:HD-GYP domain-containing protein (c-di-GMP phosphodiesterase class II)